MPKRKRVKVGGKKFFYVERNKRGMFSNIVNIFRSERQDAARRARTYVKPGYGEMGDLKKSRSKGKKTQSD